jgi:mono/diheme cytochrome c family protein
MTIVRILLGILVLIIVLGAGFTAYSWQSEIPPAETASIGPFDKAVIKRGGELAAIGNCATCHTAPGGKIFAGARDFKTPFGTIYSSNITPDPETGIGRWSLAAFTRAMREGVSRTGQHLYPVFPYDHFTLVSDQDNKALYAFLMSRPRVSTSPPENELAFPYNTGAAVAAWKLLYLRKGPYQPDPAQSESWNRGAYLVQGLGHCGACHTPRNRMGAESKGRAFSGSLIEGWYAYAINSQSPAPIRWTKDALAFYLRHGWQQDHGMARGPMAPVVENLNTAAPDDVSAIATYVADMMQKGAGSESKPKGAEGASPQQRQLTLTSADSQISPKPPGAQGGDSEGARIYAATCANCHDAGRPLPFGALDLSRSTAMQGPTPHNVINVTLYGLPARPGDPSAIMPGFRASLSDSQIVALLTYLRSRFSDKPAWANMDKIIRDARNAATAPVLYATPGTQTAPDDPSLKGAAW